MNSVVSYPDRGPFGRSSYRGNCSGYVIRDLITHYTNHKTNVLVVDPMQGGGTSADVCKFLNTQNHQIEYAGFDLSQGFNILKDELRERLPHPASLIFIHPPYANMIPYSGSVWGSQAHPDDLSHSTSYPDFLCKLQIALLNAYRALQPGGHYSLLIGDLRKHGSYYHLASDIKQLAPGQLVGVIIKQQHNCVSDKTNYSDSKLIRIAHEYILTFKKKEAATPAGATASPLDTTLTISKHLQMLADANWRALTETALHQLDGRATLEQICTHIQSSELNSHGNIKRPNWTPKVEQSLSLYANKLDHNIWALKAVQPLSLLPTPKN